MLKVKCADLSGDDFTRSITKNHITQPKYQPRYTSSMATFLSKIKRVFSSISWEVITTQNCLIFVFLTNQPKELFMKNRLAKLKLKRNQIVHFVQLDTTLIRKRFGVLVKWKQTMYQRGVRVVLLQRRIVRCCARPTIGRKGIDRKSLAAKEEYLFLSKYDMVTAKDLKAELATLKKLNKSAVTLSVYDEESLKKVKRLLNKIKAIK